MSENKFSEKQEYLLEVIAKENPKILIAYGAKRAGKTFVVGLGFLSYISNFTNKEFIVGGATQASIQRNILNDWEKILGKTFKFHKDGHFKLLGNKIYCFGGENSDSWKSVRGFTAQGALLNEATALHNSFVKECISRCSEKGSIVYMDTNPENPQHSVKVDYIDKDGQRLESGQLNIKAIHFMLDDNDALDPEYVESIKAATPSGVFYDRDILGLWVNAEGVVYKDFVPTKHIISINAIPKDVCWIQFFAGVDWGYEHKGSITVFGMDSKFNIYCIEEHTKKGELIDYWVNIAKGFQKKYGFNLQFFADSARPEHVKRFNDEGIICINANKKVLAGIECVSRIIKANKLFLIQENMTCLPSEFSLYIWNTSSKSSDSAVVKTNDDALDSLRYAIYSFYIQNRDRLFRWLDEVKDEIN
ncbi:MAG: PBSX family phage terminase large subunit [Sarcina sp.]